MKVAPKLIFLFRDADGFATSISYALQPNPSSTLRRLEDSFELSLERYGIKDRKASGHVVHFVDDNGQYEVTILLLEKYEPPVLVCALNEVLASLTEEKSPVLSAVVLPIIVLSSKLKVENRCSITTNRISLYGMQVGAETETTRAVVAKTQKPPPSLQIHHEHLACFLQLVRALKLPSCVLIGQSGQRMSNNNLEEELEMICEMGELLTSISPLCFLIEKVTWNPTRTSKESKEPWRALYG